MLEIDNLHNTVSDDKEKHDLINTKKDKFPFLKFKHCN